MRKVYKKVLSLALASAVAMSSVLAMPIKSTQAYSVPTHMKWWAKDKFGMFIHMGSYSQYGQGEWAMNEQWKTTFKKSKEKYQTEISAKFNPINFNAKDIVNTAKSAGMKYVVITAKHHEGFAMWDTKVASFTDTTGKKIYSLQGYTPFGATGRDVLQELKTECQKQGLKFGLYYSIVDWNHSSQTIGGALSSTMKSMDARKDYISDMKAQLQELITLYDPDIMWFDGDWTYSKSKPTLENWWTKDDGKDLEKYLRTLKSNLIINERVCRSFGLGDFDCPERSVPSLSNLPDRLWETCQSMNSAWGYKKSEEKSYYSVRILLEEMTRTFSGGGNFLLNIGPKGDGSMTPNSKKVLKSIGNWMKVNGESVYGTTGGLFKKDDTNASYTKKGSVVYANVYKWPKNRSLVLRRYKTKKVKKITILGKNTKLKYSIKKNKITVKVPKNAPDKRVTVLKIQYK